MPVHYLAEHQRDANRATDAAVLLIALVVPTVSSSTEEISQQVGGLSLTERTIDGGFDRAWIMGC